MWILFCIVIGILSTLGLAFVILMCLPNKGSLKKKEFRTLEFEIETDLGLYRGKARYRIQK